VVGRGPDPAQNERVGAFAAALCELAPGRLSAREAEDPEGASLALSRGGRTPVGFRVLPEGLEFAVFCAALERLGQASPAQAALTLPAPLSVEVMTLPACTHCAPVAEALCRLAIGSDSLTAWVIDLQQAPHYIGRHGLTHTPAVIVNGKTFARGRREGELAAELAAIARGEHERFSLALRLESGEAAAVAARCLAAGRLTPGLCTLVAAENFSARLGAIVALEEIARSSPELATQAAARLIALLKRPDPRDRGDAAYTLGRLGRPEALPHLEALLADPNPDVVDAAREALSLLSG
jgi:alkyl hydroperoxide reductase subunit AhpF